MIINSILILAAGKGTRLKPYTDLLPKSLLPINDTNILQNLIMQSIHYFPDAKIYINASYFAEKISSEVTKFSIARRPYVIWESEPLGPALSVSNHCNEIGGNVLVLHGDVYFSDLAYFEFANSIKQTNQDRSVVLCHQRPKNTARSMILEKNGVVKSIAENPRLEGFNTIDTNLSNKDVLSFSGAIIIKNGSLKKFKPEKGEGISPSLINYLANLESIFIEKCRDYRLSIDSEDSYFNVIAENKKNKKLFKRTFGHQ